MGMTRVEGDFSPVEIRGYSAKTGITYADYAVIAVDAEKKVLATGSKAMQYIDLVEKKASGETSVYSTFKRNVVAEFEETVAVMKTILFEVLGGKKNRFVKPKIVICIPFEITGVERKTFEELFLLVGAREVAIAECDFEGYKTGLAEMYDIVIGIIPNKLG